MALRSHNSNNIGSLKSNGSRRAFGDITSSHGNVNQSRVGGKAGAKKAGVQVYRPSRPSAAHKSALPNQASNPLARRTSGGQGRSHSSGAAAAAPAATALSTSAASAAPVQNIDRVDAHDPLAVGDYVDSIYEHFVNVEKKRQPNPAYMSKQKDLNEKMRAILVDWLVEVHLKFKLRIETLYLTVNVIDQYLQIQQVNRSKLQLVGVTALLIASKYEEIYPPEVRDLVYITDRTYTRNQILTMESVMLNALKFRITVPTCMVFLERFLKAARADKKTKAIAGYFSERMLQEYKMLRFYPSTIAASVVHLAMKASDTYADSTWTATMEHYTRHSLAALKTCETKVVELVRKGEKSSLKAVKKKFTSTKYQRVATVLTPLVVSNLMPTA